MKTRPPPFDRLRAKVGTIETIDFHPFVVSLSNHSTYFFNSLLGRTACGSISFSPRRHCEELMVRSDKTLEIRGMLSPRAEMIAMKALTALTPGEVLTIITRDVAAREKLLSLCGNLGCVMVDKKEEGGTISVQIRR